MNYGEDAARKNIEESKFLIKRAVLLMEQAFTNPNCPAREKSYDILIKANNLQKNLHDYFDN